MNTQIAIKYVDYMIEIVVAAGNDEIAMLDLTAQNMHFNSFGATEEIFSTGLKNTYRIENIEIPTWLIDGITRGKLDGRFENKSALLFAAKIARNEIRCCYDLFCLINKSGKKAQIMKNKFMTDGTLE